MPTTASVIAQYCKAAGIDHIFGYPGNPNLDLIEAGRIEGIEFILGSRESAIGFMAQAYGMLMGRPGACLSTLGPGAASIVASVANAFLDRTPMLAISGQASTRQEAFFTHEVLNHNRLFAPVTKWATHIFPENAATVMRKALHIATAERPGPVHITTHDNVLAKEADDAEIRLAPSAASVRCLQVTGGGDPIRMLENARNPVILAGLSAQRSEAGAALKRLAEKLGCGVVVSPMAKGVFPETHPQYAGAIDMACNAVIWDFLAASDLILAAGFDPVELIKPWTLKVPTIHLDSTPNIDQIYFAEIEMVGHVPSMLDYLADGYRGGAKSPALEAHRASFRAAYYKGRVEGKLNPTDVVDAINDIFPADTIVTTDVGSHKLLVGQGWRATKPNSFLTTNGGSSMGFSVPAAIVAKMLHRDRQVVCTVGDGGFAMSSADLRLASSMKLGVVVVVFCDNSLNRIELKQTVKKYASVLTRFDPTDLVKLAEAMECHGARVENPGELGRVLCDARAGLDRPLVVQAVIDPSQYLSQF
ncbi:MAG: thiamine pyrophosphate-binding protein [Acidobacteriia bacterium]|nr:thiamine pyrophosphate-binding protein [Terriglobia bacterium]